MHVGNMEKGWCRASPSSAGESRSPPAWRWRSRCGSSAQVVACFFGDGAVAEGAFHEGVNMAAIWDLPVVFVCENNLYGASTRVDQVMRDTRSPTGPPLRHPGRDRRRQRRAGGLRGGPSGGRRVPQRPGAGAARTADLSPHRPFPPRRLSLSAQGGARRVVPARPDRPSGHGTLIDRGLADQAGPRCESAAEIQAPVPGRRRGRPSQPLPTVEDLTTDVLRDSDRGPDTTR